MVEAGGAVDRQFGDVRVPVLIAMAGLPGAGKSTIAEIIGARLGATIVSVDPIESAILSAGIDSDQPTVLIAGRSVIVDAVNAVEPARLQWRDLAVRADVKLRVIEVVCSDQDLHKARLEKRIRSLPHVDETSWHAVEQSVEEYDEWKGASAALPRITVDTTASIGENVETALAFLEG
jgi:predicted kinase